MRARNLKKKLAVVDHVGVKSGMDLYSLNLLSALYDKGVETHYLSNSEAKHLKVKVKKVFDEGISKNIKGFFSLIMSLIEVTIYLRSNNIKSIAFHLFEYTWLNVFILQILKLSAPNLIGIAHDLESFIGNDSSKPRKLILQQLTSKIIVHNEFSKRELISHASKLENKVHVIPHGNFENQIQEVEIEASSFLQEIEKFGKYVLFFGQIKEVKGLDILLKALSLTSDINLIIAGKTWKDDFSKYHELIQWHGLDSRVKTIIRFIEEDEKSLLFENASAIVLPYRKIYQSGVLLYAMGASTPIIASDLPPNQEVLNKGECGLLFKNEDARDLAEKIELLWSKPDFAAELSQKAKARVKVEYNWNHIANSYLQLV